MRQVLKQTKALTEITPEPLALIQKTKNQASELAQQPVAQLTGIAQTLSSVYCTDFQQTENLCQINLAV